MAWLYRRPGSKFWWIGWKVNGRQFLKSTKETDRKAAEAKLCEHEFIAKAAYDGKLTEALIESLTGKPLSRVTLKSGLDEWLKECEAATKPGTLERYSAVAGEFSAYLNATAQAPLLRDVSTDELRSFLTQKRAKTTAANANQTRKVLAVFFLRAIRNGMLRDNPMLPIRQFKPGKDEPAGRRALTLAELQLVYQKAPDEFWRYMVIGAFYSGLRMGDLISLQWGAIDFDASMLRLLAGKTGKPLRIPIAKPFRTTLLELRAKRNTVRPGESVWPEQAELYGKQGAKPFSADFYEQILVPAGLAARRKHRATSGKGRDAQREVLSVSFHSIRHSFVSFLKVTGAAQSTAKELAGHSSDQVSDLYTHVPEESLKAAVNALPEVVK
jgi:integrase